MPTYGYDCEACGPFTAMRPMAEFRDPCACPTCGVGAPRAFLGAPAIAGTNPARRWVPVPSGRDADGPRRGNAAHPAGCGCCVRRWPLPGALASNGGRVFSSNGPLRRSGR